MTPEQAHLLRLKDGERLTRAEIAAHLGISEKAVKDRLERARKAADRVPPGQIAAVEAAGLDLASATHGWRVIQREDGGRDSVFWKSQATTDDVLQRIRDAVEGIAPAAPVAAPEYTDADLLTIYPIADAHVGMMAWGRETGEPYNTDMAADRIRLWVARCVASSPASAQAIILAAGDTTHADDTTGQTPRGKHILDTDTRHFRTLEVTIAALGAAIETALAKHASVIVRILPGNHDPHSYMAVMFALAERYRDQPRVTVQKQPGEYFAHQFGRCLIAAHHGHGGKPERMVMFLADEYAHEWGQTRHRYLFTGHLHHHRSADLGGVVWEQLRAVTARDAYAISQAYSARAQLQGITLHRDRGEVQRVKVGL